MSSVGEIEFDYFGGKVISFTRGNVFDEGWDNLTMLKYCNKNSFQNVKLSYKNDSRLIIW